MNKLALIALLSLSFVCAWGLLSSDGSITVNGQPFHWPLEILAGGWGLLIATLAIFCVVIVMAFVLAGVGLVIFGALALGGFFLLASVSPFLLPVLLPLLIIWAVCAAARRNAPNHQNYR